MAFVCHTCGRTHDELPLDVGFDYPDPYFDVPEAERKTRVCHNPDACVVDDKAFFVRGYIAIPIIGGQPPRDFFRWGVWVSLSEKSFRHYAALQGQEIPEGTAYFGWLCNRINEYPDEPLKCDVFPQETLRPRVRIQPCDHPLHREQAEGITLQRVHDLVSPRKPGV